MHTRGQRTKKNAKYTIWKISQLEREKTCNMSRILLTIKFFYLFHYYSLCLHSLRLYVSVSIMMPFLFSLIMIYDFSWISLWTSEIASFKSVDSFGCVCRRFKIWLHNHSTSDIRWITICDVQTLFMNCSWVNWIIEPQNWNYLFFRHCWNLKQCSQKQLSTFFSRDKRTNSFFSTK